jgi:peptide/nickel transport system ATP-binding protein
MTAVLGVDDLGVTIRTDQGPVLAVAGMSFRVEQGEMLALVGESGCGKSMTALAIMGLLPASASTTGSITLNGRELTALSRRQMSDVRGREITMIFQEPMTSLNPAFTVGYQVAEMLRRHEGLDRREAQRRATGLLERVGIPAPAMRVREYPHQMSGGMRQRVMIAMAIACKPAVLIADEPTTALDVTIQAQILDVMRELREELGMTVVLITHDLGVVADIADRVEVMYAGHRVEATQTDALFARPQHPYTVGLLDAVPRPDLRVAGSRMVLRGIPGMVPTLRETPSGCVFSPRCPLADSRCRSETPGWLPVAAGHHVACFHAGDQKPALLAEGGRR